MQRSQDRATKSPARGRPRDAQRDVAILDATLSVLTEVGYDQMSVESVAARAGVAKTTIYRRYADKAALVLAAVEHRAAAAPPAVRSGDLRGVLLEVVHWLVLEVAEQEIGLLGALFAGMRSDPGLAAGMRRLLHRDEAAMTEASFRGAIQRGDHLNPHAAQLFTEIVPAVIVHRLVFAGKPCDQSFIEHLVDDILLPLFQPRKTPS